MTCFNIGKTPNVPKSYIKSVLLEFEFRSAEGADVVIGRIRQAIKVWNEEKRLLDFEVTLAIGAHSWDPAGNDGLEEILAKADQRMYEDKKRQSVWRQ